MPTELPVERLHRRLRAAPETEPDDGDDTGEPDATLSRWLPDQPTVDATGWRAAIRADPGRAGAIALGVVGLVAVLFTIFTVVREKAPPVMSAKLPPVQMVSSAGPVPPADAPVVVSVVGLVHKPGLVTLSPGARISDAVSAAGGALEGADVIGLNMARRVTDGEQIIVGIAAPVGEPVAMGSSVGPSTTAAGQAGGSPTPGLVDLNTATAEQLDALPGVGPVTAAAIVAWRAAHGRFTGIDQLGEVEGIGPARLEKLRPMVRV